ncbi:MAG: Choline-sulfatase [Planctomycetota bacterium]
MRKIKESLNMKIPVFSMIVLAVVSNPVLFSQESTGTYKPNIILCMADDLGSGDPGFNGNKIIKTPHLDAMAKNSLRFERFYSGAPVCSPTRGSCITGRHPYRYGIWSANQGHMRKQEVTLAEILKSQGYATGHFGKWHLGTLDPNSSGKGKGRNAERNFSTPNANGFDEWFSTEYSVRTWDPLKNNILNPYYHNGKVETKNTDGCDSRVLMDRAIPFIRKAAKEKTPFLAVIWFHAPHEPVVAGPEFLELYPGYADGEKNYYGVVSALDLQVGRLRKELRELGLADDTMLWFTSDNGPEGDSGDKGTTRGSAGPFRGRKRSLYEGGIRVPGLLEWPKKISPGETTSFPASTLDYFPTILDVLGFKFKENLFPIDGISLLPMFDGKIKQRPVPIPFETLGGTGSNASRGSPRMALVDNQYKLLTDLDDKGSSDMLFDLLNDKGESKNIATQHPDVVKSMKVKLMDFRESCRSSQLGKDYSTKFTPDKFDVNPNDSGAVKKVK